MSDMLQLVVTRSTLNPTETAHQMSDMLQLVVTRRTLNPTETAHQMCDTLQLVVALPCAQLTTGLQDHKITTDLL